MLQNNLYKILSSEKLTEDSSKFSISINENHPIFGGHFPEQPVMPGVCQLQILIELSRPLWGESLNLKSGSNLKFLAMLDPRTVKEITVKIELKEQNENGLRIIGSMFNDEFTFFKFRGILV